MSLQTRAAFTGPGRAFERGEMNLTIGSLLLAQTLRVKVGELFRAWRIERRSQMRLTEVDASTPGSI